MSEDLAKDKKRILQANVNNQGGAFSVIFETQKKLQDEFVFDYFSADKFVGNDVYQQLLSMGSRCIGGLKTGNRIFKQYEIYKKFSKYLSENSNIYEVVHIHADTAWKALIFYISARRQKINNIIVHSHSCGINGHYKIINYLLHLLSRPIIKTVGIKCACSGRAAEWMFNTKSDVNIIHNGIDPEEYRFNIEARNFIRKQLGIENKIVIGHVSDFSAAKNPEFLYALIKAFQNDDRYAFLMVGNREGCTLKSNIARDRYINNVIFTGMVTNVQDYLNAMDIFILPSHFEGFGISAVEAEVNGTYVFVSENVTDEVECSNHFSRLELNLELWKKEILRCNLNYCREDVYRYIDVSGIDLKKTREEFRNLYVSENRYAGRIF